jgi:hypothetical protein
LLIDFDVTEDDINTDEQLLLLLLELPTLSYSTTTMNQLSIVALQSQMIF